MKFFKKIFIGALALCLTTLTPAAAFAATKAEVDTLIAHMPENWPEGPEIASEAAILVDADSGAILYAKNATRSMYPASTTKLMTAYLTLTHVSLDDIVTFSKNAIYSLPSGSSHIGMKVGESLSVKDCLYGLLLPSANEVATALAEQVSGSVTAFVELMNTTAAELGCVNTHFANANGLQDPNHMTCAYDLYLIMRACISNSTFVEISSTTAYNRPADEVLDRDIPMGTTNMMIKKDSEYYLPSIVCGKTGWTSEAGRCLVTYASQDGRNLICVVLNSESPNQCKDTTNLVNYGFDHFTNLKAAGQDKTYSSNGLASNSPLGIPDDTQSLLSLDTSSSITLPDTASFSSLTRRLVSSDDGTKSLSYELEGYPLGSAKILDKASDDSRDLYAKDEVELSDSIKVTNLHVINLWLLLAVVVVAVLIVLVIIFMIRYMNTPTKPQKPEHEPESEHQYKFQ